MVTAPDQLALAVRVRKARREAELRELASSLHCGRTHQDTCAQAQRPGHPCGADWGDRERYGVFEYYLLVIRTSATAAAATASNAIRRAV